MRIAFLVRAVLIFLVTLASPALGQCTPQWLPGPGMPGLNGTVYGMTMWDSDGQGPGSKALVVGGNFSVAGGSKANGVAMFDFDAQRWVRLGNNGSYQQYGAVTTFAVSPDGQLYCGGNFLWMEGVVVNNIARWNGNAWVSVGGGLSGKVVSSLAFLPGGDLVAGSASGTISRWNGTTWKVIGYCDGSVDALAVLPDQSLVAGGTFQNATNVWVNNIARWDGATWSSLGTGYPNGFGLGILGSVKDLLVLKSGELLVAGAFSRAGFTPAVNLAKWDGANWTALTPNGSSLAGGEVRAVCESAQGHIVVGGTVVSRSNANIRVVASWDGTTWIESTEKDPPHFGITTSIAELPDGRFAFGTSAASTSQGSSLDGVNVGDGRAWTKLGKGLSEPPSVVKAHRVGAYVGGSFTHADGVRVNGIAHWNGIRFTGLGEGLSENPTGRPAKVNAIAVDPFSQDVVVAGQFTKAGAVSANAIARWDGLRWHAVGGSSASSVADVEFDSVGRLLAAGGFAATDGAVVRTVAWLDGSVWRPLGTNLSYQSALLNVNSSGEITVAGRLLVDGVQTNAARWNGAAWISISTGANDEIYDISSGGDALFALVGFPGKLSTRNGASWQPLTFAESSSTSAVAGVSGSEFFVAGSFNFNLSGGIASRIVRWQAGELKAMGSGLSGLADILSVWDLDWGGTDLYAIGNFQVADSHVSARLARWASNPVPTIVEVSWPPASVAFSELSIQANVEAGWSAVSCQWQRELPPNSGTFENIVNGSSGASPNANGGTVSGASGQLPSPTDGTPAILTITNIQPSDAGLYRVTFWNSCGEATSIPVEVKVKAHITDINADGQVDDADFILFLNQYDLMLCADASMPDACSADFDQDGFVDDADFAIFVPAYSAMRFNK
ncbi:MAG: hypothetical protein JNM86_13630 [Phycisphaerae bacterium]|nr:hypothetical protein [Phycisphaerae bacterium]